MPVAHVCSSAELSAQLQASQRRTTDVAEQRRAVIETVATRDEEFRASREAITRRKTEEVTFVARMDELARAQARRNCCRRYRRRPRSDRWAALDDSRFNSPNCGSTSFTRHAGQMLWLNRVFVRCAM